jgi:hypothetical protein
MSAPLRAALLEQGGLLAALAAQSPTDGRPPLSASPAQTAARGPRAAGHEAEYELLIEMIFEGALLHYGEPRVVRPTDPDLALLLGDQLYALGLSRLAALGDVEATAELADVISLVAQAHAGNDAGLADAVWVAGATAVGWGTDDRLEDAKALARVHDPGAGEALRTAAASIVARSQTAPG